MSKTNLPYEKTVRRRLSLKFSDHSRTKQAHKDECDINLILAKYQKTQLFSHVNDIQGQYGDFSDVADYQSALNAVMDAQDRFMGLPAQLRARFQNDPAILMQFVSDDSNYEEAARLGLLSPEKTQAFFDKKNLILKPSLPSSSSSKSPSKSSTPPEPQKPAQNDD